MNTCVAEMPEPDTAKKAGFFTRWVVRPIKTQLTQGVSPRRLAWAVSVGSLCGIFPIIGSTSLLTTVAGFGARLNQPVLHAFKTIVIPLQWALLPLFVRIGETIFRAPPVTFNIPDMIKSFGEDPGEFMRRFGMTGLHGIAAWTLLAPIIAFLIYLIARPILEHMATRLAGSRKENSA